MTKKLRTIYVADVHGCLDELEELLKKAQYSEEQDTLIFMGDLIDRGPYSLETVRKVKSLNAKCVLGNHEEKLLRWWKHYQKSKQDSSYVIPMQSHPHYYDFTENDINYIKTFPLFIKHNNWTTVHAGLEPNIVLEKQNPQVLMRIRHVDKNGKMIPLRKAMETPDKKYWTDNWNYEYNVVYGHMVHGLDQPYVQQYNGTYCCGIDTGACFGGNLTAMIVFAENEQVDFIQVKAKKEYVKIGFHD